MGMHNEVIRAVRRVVGSATEPHHLLRHAADTLARSAGMPLVCLIQCEGRRALQTATAGDRRRAQEARLVLETGVLPSCIEWVTAGAAQIVHYPDDTRCRGCLKHGLDEWPVTLPLAFGGARRGAMLAMLPPASASDEEEMALLRDVAEEITRGLIELERVAALDDAQSRLRAMAERGAVQALRARALDAAPVGIVITDRDGRVVHANTEALAMSGWERGDAMGRSLSTLTSPATPNALDGALRPEGWRGELDVRTREGLVRREELSITPMYDDGVITNYLAVKRLAHGTSLGAAQAEDLTELLAWLPIPVTVAQRDGVLRSFNRAFVRTYGYTVADTPTVDALVAAMFTDPTIRPKLDANLARRLATKDPMPPSRFPVRCKDGSTRMVEMVGHRVGEFMLGTFTDVTAQTTAVEDLRVSEDRYRSLVDGLSALVLTTTADGVVTFVSAAVANFGATVHQVQGRHVAELFHPSDRATVHRMLEQPAAGAGAVELRFDVGSQPRIVRTTARAIPGDRAGGIGFILDDVTAERNVERQLVVAQRMEAIGRLAGGIAHDFNNVLSVILSYTELVADALPEGSPQRADLDEVLIASHRAEALTRQLLAFGRKQMLVTEPVDLHRLTASLSRLLERVVGDDVRLTVDLGARTAITLADRSQLEQVLMNLVVNARDALPDGGAIEITSRDARLDAAHAATLEVEPGDFIELAVRDDGTGISPENLPRIFEPFFTTKEAGQGTGLGLATVYGIVRQSGGAVQVESKPGAGTTMRLYFRVHRGAEAQPTPPMPKRAAKKSACVLVVEDEPALRAVVRRVLVQAGYSVLEAGSGIDALGIFTTEQAKIGLVLTDVVMPGMTGRELADRIHKLSPTLPIVFMSGYADETIARHGVLGAGFLRKPFDHETLTRHVRLALDGAPAET